MESLMRLAALFSILLALPLATLAEEQRSDQSTIGEVIEQFREAILEKDRNKFLGTFLHKQVT